MEDKILFIELAGIGDAILSGPAIRNLRRCFPAASIAVLTFPETAQLLEKCPYLDRLFVLRRGVAGFSDSISTLIELRKMNFDKAINLYRLYSISGAFKMRLLLSLIKPKIKIGRNTDDRGSFFDIKIDDFSVSQQHDAQVKLDLIEALGCRIEDKHLEVWFDDSDTQAIRSFLEKNSISDSDLLIGINPGSRRPSRRWREERYAAVADELVKKYKAKIIITGSQAEHGLIEKIICKMFHPPIDTCGRLSLTHLAALINKCRLFISNDTAPMHIANALKVPLVAIMGPGTMRTAPYQKENCVILKKDSFCAPCYKFRCPDKKCLDAISVDEVIEACGRLLKTA